MATDPQKIEAILQWPLPKNLKAKRIKLTDFYFQHMLASCHSYLRWDDLWLGETKEQGLQSGNFYNCIKCIVHDQE